MRLVCMQVLHKRNGSYWCYILHKAGTNVKQLVLCGVGVKNILVQHPNKYGKIYIKTAQIRKCISSICQKSV